MGVFFSSINDQRMPNQLICRHHELDIHVLPSNIIIILNSIKKEI